MKAESRPASILVIDDEPANLLLLKRLLISHGYQVQIKSSGITAIAAAEENPPDLILLDISLPEMDGYDVCTKLKEIDHLKDVPVIFFSALSDVLDKVKAFSVGGIDYIPKPFDFEEVLARVQTHLKIHMLQTQLAEKTASLEAEIDRRIKAEQGLVELASLDPLTGIYNRRAFYELAEKELIRKQRYGNSITLLMMDIDHFKRVNDSYGHLAGDHVLIAFAALCQRSLRSFDLVARYGGEEFIVFLPRTDLQNGISIAERLRKALAQTEFDFEGIAISITISIGVVNLDAGESATLPELIDRADQALYHAKQIGRNQVNYWLH
jgi:diguanylate cyclase (GGDEF)-like protein